MQAAVFYHHAPRSTSAWEICGKERLQSIPHHSCPAWGSSKNPSYAAQQHRPGLSATRGCWGPSLGPPQPPTALFCARKAMLCPTCDQEFAHIGVSTQAGQDFPCI